MNPSIQLRSWVDLPREIVNNIFDLLDEDGDGSIFIQCQLICKKWTELARKQMYDYIEVTSVNQLLELAAVLCSPKSNVSKYVKVVSLNVEDEATPLYSGLIRLLLTMCLNITEVYIPPDHASALLQGIRKAYDQGACRHFERLPAPDPSFEGEDLADYQDVTFKLCNSLTEVCLLPCPEENGLERLKQFPKITLLHTKLLRLDTLYYIGKYLNDCLKLNELYLTGSLGRDMLHSNQTHFVACQYITSCAISSMPLTNTLFQFITHALPNLKELIIDQIKPEVSIDGLTSALWVEFLNYIHNKIEYFFISSSPIADLPNVLSTYLQTMAYPDLILRLEYSIEHGEDSPFVTMATLERQTFEIPQKCTPSPRNRITVSYPDIVNDDAIIPPHLELIEAAGDRLKFLSFTGSKIYHSTYELYNGFYLDHIFKHCTSLTTLIVSDHYRFIDYNQYRSQIINMSISTLRLQRSGISPKIIPELSARLPNLKHLLLCDIWLIDHEGNRQKNNSNYTLEMANMTLNSLTWQGQSHLNPIYYKNIHVKLVRPNETSCIVTYTRMLGKFSKFTDIEFSRAWDENETLCRDGRSKETKSACFLIQGLDIKMFDIVFGFQMSEKRVEFPLDQGCDAYYSSS